MDAIMNLIGDFDPATLLPDIFSTVGLMELFAHLAILVAPVLLLSLGLLYFFKPIGEANHIFGFRGYFGMGSVEAWRFAQRFAGFIYIVLGGVLMLAMLIISIVMINQNTLTMLTIAAISLIVEAVLTGIAVLGINIYLGVRYDRDGYLRGSR